MTGKRRLEMDKKDDLGNSWTVAPTHSLAVMEEIILEATSKHIRKCLGMTCMDFPIGNHV